MQKAGDFFPEALDLGCAGQLPDWYGALLVARHVDSCPCCGDRRRAVTSPWALLSGVVMLPAPPELRERVLGDVRLVADGSPEPDSSAGGPDPSAVVVPGAIVPAALAGLGRSAVVRGAAAVLVLAALAGALVMFWTTRHLAG